jgi:hypothetical protein
MVDPVTGVLTTRTSTWVRSISLGDGEVELDDVVSEATAVAGGQAGSAFATFDRTIGQLRIGGETQCGPCDPAQVVALINAHQYTYPTVRASAPVPEGAAADGDTQHYEIPGTPGGAQAELKRAADLQLEDQAMNEQSPYDQQVPAMRLELANDSLRHVELIVDLAAPQAFSRLQILAGDATLAPEETTTTTAPPTSVPEEPPVSAEEPATVVEPPSEPIGPLPGAPGFSPALASYTPPASPAVVVASPPVMSAPPAPVMPGVLGQVESGLRAALTSPSRFLALLLVWGVMAIPVYLVARRRLVVDFILGSSEVVT